MVKNNSVYIEQLAAYDEHFDESVMRSIIADMPLILRPSSSYTIKALHDIRDMLSGDRVVLESHWYIDGGRFNVLMHARTVEGRNLGAFELKDDRWASHDIGKNAIIACMLSHLIAYIYINPIDVNGEDGEFEFDTAILVEPVDSDFEKLLKDIHDVLADYDYSKRSRRTYEGER